MRSAFSGIAPPARRRAEPPAPAGALRRISLLVVGTALVLLGLAMSFYHKDGQPVSAIVGFIRSR